MCWLTESKKCARTSGPNEVVCGEARRPTVPPLVRSAAPRAGEVGPPGEPQKTTQSGVAWGFWGWDLPSWGLRRLPKDGLQAHLLKSPMAFHLYSSASFTQAVTGCPAHLEWEGRRGEHGPAEWCSGVVEKKKNHLQLQEAIRSLFVWPSSRRRGFFARTEILLPLDHTRWNMGYAGVLVC